jgi:hypothetical protein
MRLLHLEPQLKRNYLYESLDNSGRDSIILWETAGVKLKEAALTADQIQNLFKEIEAGATAGGDNRTMLGKGKDAVSAVNKAWEDLKTKMQDSGPVKNFDQKVSDVLSKIGMGAAEPEFNGEVNKWVQKYRDFAKKHPIAQGAIYATLIALAGISGAGIGGAAALGLLKMADQLLQGKRFSSAAYSGVKTGVLAFGASKLGDYIKGLMKGDQIPAPGGAAGELPPELVPKMDFDKYDYYLGYDNNIVSVAKGAPNPFTGGGAGGIGNIDGADLVSGVSNAAKGAGKSLSDQILDQSLSNPAGRSAARQAVAAALDSGDIAAGQAKELLKQIGSAAANPEAAERAITQTLQNVGSSAAQTAAQNVGTSAADIAASISDVPAGGGIKAPDFDAGDAASAVSKPPYGANMDPEYLKRVVDADGKSGVRFKISPEDAQKALDYQAATQGADAASGASKLINKPSDFGGYSKEYLQQVAAGEHPRPMISKEKAAELLQQTEPTPVPPEEAGKTRPFANKTRLPASDVQTTTAPDGTTTTTGTLKGVTADQIQSHPAYKAEIERFGDNPESRRAAAMKARAALLKGESRSLSGRRLSEGQVYMVFNRVCARNDLLLSEGVLREGPFDAIKGFAKGEIDNAKGMIGMGKDLAGKGWDWMKTKGKNLTTKVTADKLNSAWKSAGSPMDSNAIADLLKAQGVADTVISSVYSQLKLPAPGAADQAGTVDIETVKQMIAKLPTDRKVRLINYMTKQLKVA